MSHPSLSRPPLPQPERVSEARRVQPNLGLRVKEGLMFCPEIQHAALDRTHPWVMVINYNVTPLWEGGEHWTGLV